jgi:23S rRNA (uracil1939-C5)-methyltransferase
VKLTIQKLIYGGDGLSRMPEGKTVFLPFVLAGEEVSATVVEEKSGFARATVNELLKPSAMRQQPPCSYFGRCGGCHYQHASYSAQLDIKRAALKETLLRTAKLDWQQEITVHAGEPWNYRNRVRFKVRTGNDFAIGYHRTASHDLLPVEQCPISSPLINRALQQLWKLGREQRVPQGIKEIELFASHDDARLLMEIYAIAGAPPIQEFAQEAQRAMPEVKGVALFTEAGSNGQAELQQNVGETFLNYQVGEKVFRVSAGSFFQTNRFLLSDLVHTVMEDCHGKTALDLYAGVGLFAYHLAKRFEQVFAVESSPVSSRDLDANVPKNVTPVHTTTEQFLPKCLNLHPDMVVADPPRSGLGDQAAKLLASLRVSNIIYVSCDPATLARDLRLLLESGYRVEGIHLVDLFPQTFHIESIVRLTR